VGNLLKSIEFTRLAEKNASREAGGNSAKNERVHIVKIYKEDLEIAYEVYKEHFQPDTAEKFRTSVKGLDILVPITRYQR